MGMHGKTCNKLRVTLLSLPAASPGVYLINMRRYASPSAERDFRQGRRELARHRPDKAVRSLRTAVGACPAKRSGELARNLYWLALALLRLDRPELAIKSLASAKKLRPRGVARWAYLSRVNAYGMVRRARPELDDFYAFYSIKACSYLGSKKEGRFDSNAEKDTVTRLIGDAWRALVRAGKLSGLPASGKLVLFQSWPIDFPFFGLPGAPRGRVLSPDFQKGVKIGGCECAPNLKDQSLE